MNIVATSQITIVDLNDSVFVPNLLPWSTDWVAGSGSLERWAAYGDAAENVRSLLLDPFGYKNILWRCIPDADGGASGGFTIGGIRLNREKTYRYTCFIKLPSTMGGTLTIGMGNVKTLAGVSVSNAPAISFTTAPQADRWYLLVCILHPAGTTSSIGKTGIYDMRGAKLTEGTEYAFGVTSEPTFYVKLDGATTAASEVQLFMPTLECLDGTEESIQTLIRYDGSENDYLREFIEWDSTNNALRINGNFYATGSVSAQGVGTGGGGTSYNRLDTWASYIPGTTDTWVLSALLGHDLHTRVTALESDTPNVVWGVPTTDYVPLTVNAISRQLSVHGHGHTFASLASKPTTIAGYGITDSLIYEGDARLTNSRPASDVSAWAKAATKPSYSYTEVGAAAASHVHAAATTSDAGFMSTTDKSKLDGIEAQANNYIHPTKTSRSAGGASHFITAFTSDTLGHVTGITTAAMAKADVEAVLVGNTITSHYHDDRYFKKDELFTKEGSGTEADPYRIKANFPFYSVSSVAALGIGVGGGGTSYDRLDTWASYDSGKAGWVLSAALGYDLHGRVSALESSTPNIAWGVAGSGYIPLAVNGVSHQLSTYGHTHTKSSITDFAHTHDDRYYTETEVNTLLANSSNWNTAYGWGNHASAGYAANSSLTSHTGNTSNPHGVTASQLGLGSVNNTADSEKNVLSATKLTTARTLWGQSFDGTANVSGSITGATTISASSTISATTAILSNLTAGYVPYHTAGGLVNGPIYTDGTNVAIGQATPGLRFSVNVTPSDSVVNGFGVFNNLLSPYNAINNGVSIILGKSYTAYYSKIAAIFEGSNPDYLRPSLAFFTMENTYAAGSEVERMRISSKGNVGIGYSTGTEISNYKLAVNGSGFFNGNLTLSSADGTFMQIGAGRLVWDNTNNAIKVIKADGKAANFYATGSNSAQGIGTGGGGASYNMVSDWSQYVAGSELWVVSAELINALRTSVTGHIGDSTHASAGEKSHWNAAYSHSLVTGGVHMTSTDRSQLTTAYNFANGFATAYPDLTAIEAITGTSGLLKKTAANTWSLDTNTYITGITKAMVESVLTGGITSHTHAYDAAGTAAGAISSHNTTYNHDHIATAYGWGNHASVGYLTAITKAQVEAVLTGGITSHTHAYLPLTGGSLSGQLRVQIYDIKSLSISSVSEITDGVLILCPAGQGVNNNVLGSLYIERSSGYYGIEKVDFGYSVGETTSAYSTYIDVKNGISAGTGVWTFVHFTYNSVQYIGLRRVGAHYWASECVFTGLNLYTGTNSLTWVPTANGVVDDTLSLNVSTKVSGNLSAPTFIGALSGNASTATKLETTRALTIGNTSKNFDGSAAVSWSLAEIGAASLAGASTQDFATKNLAVAGTSVTTGMSAMGLATPYAYAHVKGGIITENPNYGVGNAGGTTTQNRAGIVISSNHATNNSVFWISTDATVGNALNIGVGNTFNDTYKRLSLGHDGLLTAANFATANVDGAYVQIGPIKIIYDDTNGAIRVEGNIYATGSNTAFGVGGGAGGGGLITNVYNSSYFGRTYSDVDLSSTFNAYAINSLYTALQGKQDTITGAISTLVSSNLYANYALVSGATGKIQASGVTATELSYLSGASSNIQSQLNAKPSVNSYPTAFSWNAGSTSGPTGTLSGSNMTAVSFGAIPAASGTASGIVTTGSQIFAGTKNFIDGIDVKAAAHFRTQLKLLNKAENNWLTFAERNTLGTEAVMDLSNIGTINSIAITANSVSLAGTNALILDGASQSIYSYEQGEAVVTYNNDTAVTTHYWKNIFEGLVEVKTGKALTFDLSTQSNGSIAFSNASGSNEYPTITGKSTSSSVGTGLYLMGATADTNDYGDMVFNVRKNNNSDFTTLTKNAFRWSRYGTVLMSMKRNGLLTLQPTTNSLSGSSQQVNTHEFSLNSANSPTYSTRRTDSGYGMIVMAMTINNNTAGADMLFNVREQGNVDYNGSYHTQTAFRWDRYGTVLFAIQRNGVLRKGAMDTAPDSATAAGVLGEIRFTSTGLFICIATNTWRKATISTF